MARRFAEGELLVYPEYIWDGEMKCFLCHDASEIPMGTYNCLRLTANQVSAEGIRAMLDEAEIKYETSPADANVEVLFYFGYCFDHDDACREFWRLIEDDGGGFISTALINDFLSQEVEKECDCDAIHCTWSTSLTRRDARDCHKSGQLIIVHRCPQGPSAGDKFIKATEHYNVYQGNTATE